MPWFRMGSWASAAQLRKEPVGRLRGGHGPGLIHGSNRGVTGRVWRHVHSFRALGSRKGRWANRSTALGSDANAAAVPLLEAGLSLAIIAVRPVGTSRLTPGMKPLAGSGSSPSHRAGTDSSGCSTDLIRSCSSLRSVAARGRGRAPARAPGRCRRPRRRGGPSRPISGDARRELLLHRVRAGEVRQQRRVDVDHGAGEAVEEGRREEVHVAGEHDEARRPAPRATRPSRRRAPRGPGSRRARRPRSRRRPL